MEEPPKDAIDNLVSISQATEQVVRHALKEAKNDTMRAYELLEKEKSRLEREVKEKEDLDRAMQLSLKDSSSAMDVDSSGGGFLSSYDQEVSRAIEASLNETKGTNFFTMEPQNPRDRMREKDLPVGLKNVGNTCYVNSLLQSYFLLPPIRQLIMAVQGVNPNPGVVDLTVAEEEDKSKEADKDVQEVENEIKRVKDAKLSFLREIQILFGKLKHSSRKYVDPSNVLKNLLDSNEKTVELGNQEDVGEFNDKFLHWLELSLEEACGDESSSNKVEDLFFGKCVDEIYAKEQDESIFTSSTEDKFGCLIVPVQKDISSLHSAILAAVDEEVELTTGRGYSTRGRKTRWLQKAPPVLMIQQQRVYYDKKDQVLKKNNQTLSFPEEIYLDRYMHEYKEKSAKLRREERTLWERWQANHEHIMKFYNYNDTSYSLSQSLANSADFICKLKDPSTSNITTSECTRYENSISEDKLDVIADGLRHYQEIIERQVERLEDESTSLHGEIDTLYDDMKVCKYSLHAVLIHSGFPGSGHYYSYIFDPYKKLWFKYNDMNVTKVEWEEVKQCGYGSKDSSASAYCLIYVDSSLVSEAAEEEPIELDYVMEAVKEDNKKLEEEIVEWDEKLKKKMEENVQTFVNSLQKELEECETSARSFSSEKDARISSFETFMCAIEKSDLVKLLFAPRIYKNVFSKNIEEDRESEPFQRLLELQGNLLISEESKQEIEVLRNQHEYFCMVILYFAEGLRTMSIEKYEDALKYLVKAGQDVSGVLLGQESNYSHEISFCTELCLEALAKQASASMVSNHQEALRLYSIVIEIGCRFPNFVQYFIESNFGDLETLQETDSLGEDEKAKVVNLVRCITEEDTEQYKDVTTFIENVTKPSNLSPSDLEKRFFELFPQVMKSIKDKIRSQSDMDIDN